MGGIGRITFKKGDMVHFTVSSIKDLSVVLTHFSNYPLITQKKRDFELFKRAVEIMNNKDYNKNLDGIQYIVNIKASLNLGLSLQLKEAFPQTIPAVKPLTITQEIPHPEWIAGFTSGEGCFSATIRKSLTKIGYNVELTFILTQHIRDEQLMNSLVAYFGCGSYYKHNKSDYGWFKCGNFSDLDEKIIPFFKEFKIRGVKALDFKDWTEIANIIKTKAHLTPQGLSRIQKIKGAGMNRSRTEY